MSDLVHRIDKGLQGRYRIERELGIGGMATVYLADDVRHGRRVALKVLKPELAATLGLERFLTEIRTTANLHHPNILPLFDSGDADGLLYYVMPYVEGESLRERLDREGPLPLDQAVRIALDVAEAIQAAHDQGVIHRDIKPANVLLSRGRAMVADFGIARAAELSEGERLTKIGASVGTAGYMSPEQVAGSDDVDHRSDIYSLGCTLYEMLAGEPPYAAPTLIAVLARQVTEPVPSVTRLRPDVPASLERALRLALARDPGERFASATAFAQALIAAESRPVAPRQPQERTVIVLPFANRSGSEDNEYFSDGLTEEVISDLSGLPELRVISRNSAMALKGTTKGTATLARELGVTHLVTGSVRRAGDALRVTAELVEARSDTPLWSEKFSGTVEDVFGIQEEISRQIVSALHVTLGDAAETQVAARPIDDVVAYDCYLRARRELYLWTPEAQRRALQLVDQAMEIVGESPLLLATSGLIHWGMVMTSLVRPEEGLPRAEELAARALAVDPDSGLAVFVRGITAGSDGRRLEALADLYRAKDLLPDDSTVLAELCRYSNSSGLRHYGKYVEQLLRIDPLNPVTHLIASYYRLLNGPVAEAAPPARRAMELLPPDVSSMMHIFAGAYISEAGFRDEGTAILLRAAEGLDDRAGGDLANFFGRVLQGDRDGALRYATAALGEGISNEFLARIAADGFALLGLQEEALHWLRRAVDMGYLHWPNLAEDAVFLERLRGTREFQQLLDAVKPRWEALVEWERTLDP